MIKNFRLIKFSLLVFSLNLACGSSHPALKENTEMSEQRFEQIGRERDSYLIYSTVINNLSNQSGYVVHGKTTVYFLPYKNLDQAIEDMFQGKEIITNPEVLTSFLMQNREPHDLKANFDLRYPYTLVSSEKLSKIFANGGWENFQRSFPDRFYIKLSSIGYSSQGDEALVYLGRSKSGDYYVLKKQGTSWTIVHKLNAWVS